MHGENYSRPPPELEEGQEEYEVKKILDTQRFGRGRRLQYLIKWKGYADLENQWVNQSDVFTEEAIAEFQASNSAAKMYIRSMRTEESPITSSFHTSMSSTLSPPTTPVVHHNDHHGGLH